MPISPAKWSVKHSMVKVEPPFAWYDFVSELGQESVVGVADVEAEEEGELVSVFSVPSTVNTAPQTPSTSAA